METLDTGERSSTEYGPVTSGSQDAANKDYADIPPVAASAAVPRNTVKGSVGSVLQSDIGVNTLLSRLKQSIVAARDFANFLKKRSILEEEQAQGLRKLCRSNHDSVKRHEVRQGSYARSYDEIIKIHDRMAGNGIQFALSLHQMHEDLQELASNTERGRKLWKQNGLAAEKKVQEAEASMEKAKSKYNNLAEDYDRARTGDKATGRVFGLKGPKSAAQHEEDLQRKVQQADTDYASKVQVAQSQRQELFTTLRPQAVKALHDLINECDSGLTLQLQKFAVYNERLLLGNGICVNPLEGHGSKQERSLRQVVAQIDNVGDLDEYVAGFTTRIGDVSEIKYERHPTLILQQNLDFSNNNRTQAQQERSVQPLPSHDLATSHLQNGADVNINPGHATILEKHATPQLESTPPQLPPAPASTPFYNASPAGNESASSIPSIRPSFGVSLDELLNRDHIAIPFVVYQCLQAVDLFGLEVEGIYRLSGSATHIGRLKSIFNHDPTQLDFRNPDTFFHDVNSVSGLLKQFFRELPNPLLTRELYSEFIAAARIDDDIMRRDSMHAAINALPDPNYATLRALILHLDRVQQRAAENRMNAGNIAIIFGPTLMGSGPNVADSGWQVRVIDTILQNTYQIFDDD